MRSQLACNAYIRLKENLMLQLKLQTSHTECPKKLLNGYE